MENFELRELLDFHLITIKGTSVTVGSVIAMLVIVLVAIAISHILRRAIERAFSARGVTSMGTIVVTTRLTHYIVLIIGLGIGLNTLGIDLTALFAAGAVFAVGLGFAMQNIAQNFVSGVIVLIERSITPGDIIRVNDRIVRVTRMSIRTTHVRTLDDEEMILPNSDLVQSVVTNYTLGDTLYRIGCDVGVIYGSDMRLVENTIRKAVEDLDWRVQGKDPVVRMVAFGSSSVDWRAMVWVDDPWTTEHCRAEMHKKIWWALKDAGVTIAFPQLDVHFDPEVVEGLARAS